MLIHGIYSSGSCTHPFFVHFALCSLYLSFVFHLGLGLLLLRSSVVLIDRIHRSAFCVPILAKRHLISRLQTLLPSCSVIVIDGVSHTIHTSTLDAFICYCLWFKIRTRPKHRCTKTHIVCTCSYSPYSLLITTL